MELRPLGNTVTGSPTVKPPPAKPAGEATEIGALGTDHALHIEACRYLGETGPVEGLEPFQQRRPGVPRRTIRQRHDVVAVQRADRERDHGNRRRQRFDVAGEILDDGVELALVPFDEVHLVDGEGNGLHAEQRSDERMPASLLEDAVACVDEHDGDVGGRGARHHVPRVLRVARCVGDDEAAMRCCEVAMGDVDRDALLALGTQTVGQQGEVALAVAIAPAGLFDRGELILEHRLGVVQQPTDQSALAVVDAAGSRDAKCAPWRRVEVRAEVIRNSPLVCGLPWRIH